MKSFLTFFVAFSLTLGWAQSTEPSFRSVILPEFLQQFDTNEDGLIDEEERQAIRDLRGLLQQKDKNTIDTDRDGSISAEEIQTARDTLRARIEKRRMEKFIAIAGEDARISLKEYLLIPGAKRLPEYVLNAIFHRLDYDQSGDISAKEFRYRLRKH